VERSTPRLRKSPAVGLLLGLLGTVLLAEAQEEPSKFDLYGGYYCARINLNAKVPGIAPRRDALERVRVVSLTTTPKTDLEWWEI
jgi:hypothetical protein